MRHAIEHNRCKREVQEVTQAEIDNLILINDLQPNPELERILSLFQKNENLEDQPNSAE